MISTVIPSIKALLNELRIYTINVYIHTVIGCQTTIYEIMGPREMKGLLKLKF